MGLLDGLGAMLGGQGNLMSIAEKALADAGGLNEIVAQLQKAGLGDQVASWIGTGANLPVSADQIRSALSSDQLAGIAASLGLHIDQLPQLLAEYLPKVIDAATPNGNLPS